MAILPNTSGRIRRGPMGWRRHGAVVVALVLVAVFTSGCGGDSNLLGVRSTPTPTEKASPTTEPASAEETPPDESETPSSEAPERPRLAAEIPRARLKSDIDVLLDKYFDAVNRAHLSGETERVRDMPIVGENCQACYEDLARIDEIYDAGHRIVGGDYVDYSFLAFPLEGKEISVPASAEFDEMQIVDENDELVESFESGVTRFRFLVFFDDGEYTLAEGRTL